MRLNAGDRLRDAMAWARRWAYAKRYVVSEEGAKYEAAPTPEMLYVRTLLRHVRVPRRKP